MQPQKTKLKRKTKKKHKPKRFMFFFLKNYIARTSMILSCFFISNEGVMVEHGE